LQQSLITLERQLPLTGVVTLTINRAEKSNALNLAAMRAFVDQLDQLASDRDVRAVIVTGAGEKAFVGGADIGEMSDLDGNDARGFITSVHRCCDALRKFPAPVIARINGVVFGAGLELAASADLLVATDDALFGMPEVKLGLPSVVEAAVLPGILGWAKTRELLLLGDIYDARTMYEWGLLNRVVPRDALDKSVRQMLGSLLENGPQAVRLQKRLMRQWERSEIDDAVQAGVDTFAEAFQSSEPNDMLRQWRQRKRK